MEEHLVLPVLWFAAHGTQPVEADVGRRGEQQPSRGGRLQGILAPQDFDKNIVHGIHRLSFVPQQTTTSTQDHGSMASIEAFDVHRHAGSVLAEHQRRTEVLPDRNNP